MQIIVLMFVIKLTFYIGIAGVILYCLLWPFLLKTIGKRFEKKFYKIKGIYTWRILGEKIGRFDAYIDMIANYEFYKKTEFDLYKIFKGYDFRANISKLEYCAVMVYYYAQHCAVIGLTASSLIFMFVYGPMVHFNLKT